jgi:hypothetical protein
LKTLLNLLAILAINLCAPAFAQTTFAPPGADWCNLSPDGYYHCFYAGDSTFLGKTCSIVRQKAIGVTMGWAIDFPTLYTYTSGDTVFVYNTMFGRFTPLYIFDVHEGDTVSIPDFHINYDTSIHDTSFYFRVDSIRMVTYDTTTLKSVYTHTISAPGYLDQEASTYGMVHNADGVYVERIGGIQRGIMPHCMGCGIIMESCECISNLLCYNDPTTSIKLTAGTCPPTLSSQPAVIDEVSISVYPNPSGDLLSVSIPGPGVISLLSPDGRLLRNIVANDKTIQTINTAASPEGIYILRFSDGAVFSTYRKVVVAH